MSFDAELEAKKIVRATWHSGPFGLKRTIDEVAKAIDDGRAAGYAEAIEKAAKIAATEYVPEVSNAPDEVFEFSPVEAGIAAVFATRKAIEKRIRALAPADKEKP